MNAYTTQDTKDTPTQNGGIIKLAITIIIVYLGTSTLVALEVSQFTL